MMLLMVIIRPAASLIIIVVEDAHNIQLNKQLESEKKVGVGSLKLGHRCSNLYHLYTTYNGGRPFPPLNVF